MSDEIEGIDFYNNNENLYYDVDKVKITDNILFTSVFIDTDIVKDFLKHILNINVIDIILTNKEVVKDSISKTRGVRFDVYVENDDVIYDIEIQTSDIADIAKRTRYYQSMVDSNLLNKGDKSFNKLRRSYIIFICLFNPFKSCGINQCIYQFENLCILEDNTIYRLNDMAYKIFINSKCDEKYLCNNYIKSFIELLNDGYQCVTKSSLTDKIIDKMKDLKQNEDWRRKYMDLLDREEYAIYEGQAIHAMKTVKKLIKKGWSDLEIRDFDDFYDLDQIAKIRYDVEHNAD